MKKITPVLLTCFLLSSLIAQAQSPFKPQVVLPVYFDSIAKKASGNEKQVPDALLSGIALMFLDTADTNDKLLLSGNSDIVIWHDNIGKSTLLTLVVPDSHVVGKLELMYLESKCSANIWRTDQNTGEVMHAQGTLKNDNAGYSLHFSSANGASGKDFAGVIDAINLHLMELHTRSLRKTEVKSWYNKDSINLIIGKDSQFNTNNELIWLDRTLRNRLAWVAANDFSKLYLLSNQVEIIQDSIEGRNSLVQHSAKRIGGEGVRGTISITIKAEKIGRYMFFDPKHSFRIAVDYTLMQENNFQKNLAINSLSLKNLSNGDFVDMALFDFVKNGLPIMYVDLIIGVVTDSYVPWDIANVIHFIEDVFRKSVLPNELGF